MAIGFGTTKGVGTTDKVVVNSPASPTALTIAVRYQRNGTGSNGRLITKGSTNELFGVFEASTNNIIEFSYGRGGGGIAGSGASLHYCLSGTGTGIHHLVLAYDASSTANVPTWYIDGANVANNNANAGTGTADSNTQGWNIGNGPSSNLFDGVICDVAVWGAVLPGLAGIAAALNAGLSPLLVVPSQLLLYVPGLDTTARDYMSGIASTVTGTAYQNHLKSQMIWPQGFAWPSDFHSSTPSGSISGTVAWSFTSSGALTGAGALASTSALALSASGNLNGAAAAAGSSTLVLAASGAPTGQGALASSAAVVVSASGAVVTPTIAGTAPVSLSATSTPSAAGQLGGSSAVAVSAAGAAAGQGALSSTAGVSVSASGLPGGAGAVQGTSLVSVSASGSPAGSGALSSTSALSLSATSSLLGAGRLTVTAPLSFSLSAGSGALLGSASITVSAASLASGSGALAATAGLSLSASASLLGAGALSGLAATAFAAVGGLFGQGALGGASGWAWGLGGRLASVGNTRFIVADIEVRLPVSASSSAGIVAAAPPWTPQRSLPVAAAAGPAQIAVYSTAKVIA